MALYSVRLRRSLLSLSSSLLHRNLHSHSSRRISTLLSNPSLSFNLEADAQKSERPSISHLQWSRSFVSSPVSLSTRRQYQGPNDDQEIGPDTILFEGCDYNHWLITIDFPKDEDITDEQKVETYVRTAAQVFGSVEEAKKRIYACSTSTYHGFQVECSEETSAKFQGLPGVVFILPDSYIDPVNKEYGGDKYDNGIITHRPPPSQYRPRPSRPPRENYGPPQGRPTQPNYGPPQGRSTQPNYGPPQSSPTPRSYGPPQGPSSQQFYGQPQGPPHQQSHGLPQAPPHQQNHGLPPSQQNPGLPQVPASQQNYGPPSWSPPSHQNYGPPPPASPSQQQYVPPQQQYAPPPQVPFSQQKYGSLPQAPTSQPNYTPPPQGPQSQQYYRPPPPQAPQSQQQYRPPPPQGPQSQQQYRPPPPQCPPHQQNFGLHSSAPQPINESPLRQPNYSMQQAPAQQNYGHTQDLPHQQNFGRQQNFVPEKKYSWQESSSPEPQSYGLKQNVPPTTSGGWDRLDGGRRDFPRVDAGYPGPGHFEGQGQSSHSAQGLDVTQRQEAGTPYKKNYASEGIDERFSA